jgi:hypothetical protein
LCSSRWHTPTALCSIVFILAMIPALNRID